MAQQDEDTGTDESVDVDVNFDSDGGVDFDSEFEEMLADERDLKRSRAKTKKDESDGSSSDDSDDETDDSDSDDVTETGSDDGDDDAEDEKTDDRPTNRSRESVVRRLQRSQDRVQELERTVRELRASAQDLSPVQTSGDFLEDLVTSRCKALKCKPDDPKIRSELYELAGDIMAVIDDSDDEVLRQRRRDRDLRLREHRTSREIEQLREQNRIRDEKLQEREALDGIARLTSEMKFEETYPYLFAAEDDVPGAIFEGIRLLYENGHRIDDSNVRDTVAYVVRTLDAEHRKTLSRLESVRSRASKSKDRDSNGGERTRGDRQDRSKDRNRREDQGGRTVTASGTGARSVPVRKQMSDDQLFDSMLKEHRNEQRRRARKTR